MSPKMMSALIGSVLVLIVGLMLIGNVVSWNDAGMNQVIQYPSGKLRVVTNAGPYMQWWAKEYAYKQVTTVGFGEMNEGDKSADIEAIPVIFNDGSKANISGIVRVSLPKTTEGMITIKKEYVRGYDHFVENGIVQVVKNSVRLAANLRSAQDAYTTLALFQRDIEDQLINGIYETVSSEEWVHKATGDSERVKLTKVAMDPQTNLPKRRPHILQELGCQITQCQIEVPQFDKAVEEMIARRKQETLETEIRKQEAIRAEQEVITAEKKGLAAATQVKWEKEKEKQAAVTDAEKERDVAKLNEEAAGHYKRKLILEGEGEAAKRKLVMQADGALEIKTKAWVESQRLWSEAFANYKGNIVPSVAMGEGSKGTGNGMMEFMQLMSAKAAKDLSVDLTNK